MVIYSKVPMALTGCQIKKIENAAKRGTGVSLLLSPNQRRSGGNQLFLTPTMKRLMKDAFMRNKSFLLKVPKMIFNKVFRKEGGFLGLLFSLLGKSLAKKAGKKALGKIMS